MKTLAKISVGLLLIAGVFFLSAPTYLRKALIYTTVDIDDYTIFDNREVKAGTYQPWQLHKKYNQLQIPPQYLQTIQELRTVAFLVVQDSSILHEQYWDGYSARSLSNSFSVAKSIVSVLVGIAIDEGKIKSIDQKVGDYFPEYALGENAQLSIKDLLTMSSGLNWEESYINPFSVTTQAYYGNDLTSLLLNLKVIEKPGQQFNYLSGNTQLLAMVLEKATGMRLSEYASQKLWQPLGAQHTALWSVDAADGVEKAYCCFNSNARDFARIGQLVLNKGKWNGKQIVSESYILESTQAASYLKDRDGKPVDFYGYQWWIIHHKGYTIPYARGVLGQYIFIIPEKNAVIVRLGHERSQQRVGYHLADIPLYLDAALEMLEVKK